MPMWLDHPGQGPALLGRRSRSGSTPTRPSAIRPTGTRTPPRINALDCPVSMEVGGFFGYINMWVGTEDLMYLFYDDPALVEDMMETILQLEMEMVRRVTRDIRLDWVWYWEDMAYKSGPMISPNMVRTLHAAPLRAAQRGHPRRRL